MYPSEADPDQYSRISLVSLSWVINTIPQKNKGGHYSYINLVDMFITPSISPSASSSPHIQIFHLIPTLTECAPSFRLTQKPTCHPNPFSHFLRLRMHPPHSHFSCILRIPMRHMRNGESFGLSLILQHLQRCTGVALGP